MAISSKLKLAKTNKIFPSKLKFLKNNKESLSKWPNLGVTSCQKLRNFAMSGHTLPMWHCSFTSKENTFTNCFSAFPNLTRWTFEVNLQLDKWRLPKKTFLINLFCQTRIVRKKIPEFNVLVLDWQYQHLWPIL